MPGTEASATEPAHAELRTEGDSVVVVLSGKWSLEQAQPRFETLMGRGAIAEEGVRTLSFDATELAAWDSSLLILLMRCQDYCDEHELECNWSGLPERALRLLALANAVPERVQADTLSLIHI